MLGWPLPGLGATRETCTEEAIQAALDEVKDSRIRFRAASAEKMQAQQEQQVSEEL